MLFDETMKALFFTFRRLMLLAEPPPEPRNANELLPLDIWIHILSYLDVRSLCAAASSCRMFDDAAAVAWRLLLLRMFPSVDATVQRHPKQSLAQFVQTLMYFETICPHLVCIDFNAVELVERYTCACAGKELWHCVQVSSVLRC
jgi:hypothetical protein